MNAVAHDDLAQVRALVRELQELSERLHTAADEALTAIHTDDNESERGSRERRR